MVVLRVVDWTVGNLTVKLASQRIKVILVKDTKLEPFSPQQTQ